MSSRQATVTVDLNAIQQNFNHVRELAPTSRVMAVIKADAYGHGAIQVARKLAEADAFGVARVSEAVKLREAGVQGDICLLEGVIDKEEVNLASVYELQLVVHSRQQIELLNARGARRPVWIKVDTGMGRLGLKPEDVEASFGELGRQKVLGLMTHFPTADEVGDETAAMQVAAMADLAAKLKRIEPQAAVLNVANSAGLMTVPDSRVDWVRPGLMLYGASPMAACIEDPALMPAMTFTAPIIAIRQVKAGDTVGYGSTWRAPQNARLAIVAAGYADGYPREIAPATKVLVNGKEREIVGRVSMDMLTVRLAADDSADPGDHVVLWGEGLPIEQVARQAGTIPYTLMCGIGARVRRVYRGEVRG
jgi:alanine racemase